MTRKTLGLWGGGLVAAALVSAPLAVAAPSESDAGVKAALAQAAAGPDQLRWFVQRTKAVYQLDFNEIAALAEAKKAAEAESVTKLADSGPR